MNENYCVPSQCLSWNKQNDTFFWFFTDDDCWNDTISNFYVYYKNKEVTKKKYKKRIEDIDKLMSDIDKYGRTIDYHDFIYLDFYSKKITEVYGFNIPTEEFEDDYSDLFGNPEIKNDGYFCYDYEKNKIDITKKDYEYDYAILSEILSSDIYYFSEFKKKIGYKFI